MATVRLPVPGDDVEVWGDILNTFLLVAHNGDGTLRDPVPDASITTKGRVRLNGDLGGTADAPAVISTSLNAPLPLEQGGTSANTRAGAINALVPDQTGQSNRVLKSDGSNVSWTDPTTFFPDATTSAKGKVRLNGDISGTADSVTVVSTSLTAPMPINQGGTSSNTRPGAINALLPDQATQANKVLKTDGTDAAWTDPTTLIPDATSSTKGKLRLNGDISGTADTVTVVSTSLSAPLPFSQGGTSANTRVDALNALLPLQATNNNKVLKTDGTNASWIAGDTLVPDATTTTKGKIQLIGDISGTATGVTVVSTSLAAPLPITQGGTSANTPQAALNALLPTQSGNGGKIIQTDGTNASWVAKPVFDPSDLLAMTWMEVSP